MNEKRGFVVCVFKQYQLGDVIKIGQVIGM